MRIQVDINIFDAANLIDSVNHSVGDLKLESGFTIGKSVQFTESDSESDDDDSLFYNYGYLFQCEEVKINGIVGSKDTVIIPLVDGVDVNAHLTEYAFGYSETSKTHYAIRYSSKHLYNLPVPIEYCNARMENVIHNSLIPKWCAWRWVEE
jgi:hypothetical protein